MVSGISIVIPRNRRKCSSTAVPSAGIAEVHSATAFPAKHDLSPPPSFTSSSRARRPDALLPLLEFLYVFEPVDDPSAQLQKGWPLPKPTPSLKCPLAHSPTTGQLNLVKVTNRTV